MNLEQTIERVEKLYSALTGARPPQANGPHAPIPPETDPVRHVEHQIERLVRSLATIEATSARPPTWVPRLSMWEADAAIAITIDVPGVQRDQIEITADDRTLMVRGYRRTQWDDLRPAWLDVETPAGAFARLVVLPARIDPEKVTVALRDGVLAISAPLAHGESTHRISIKQ
jgi:HSP20 family protein